MKRVIEHLKHAKRDHKCDKMECIAVSKDYRLQIYKCPVTNMWCVYLRGYKDISLWYVPNAEFKYRISYPECWNDIQKVDV